MFSCILFHVIYLGYRRSKIFVGDVNICSYFAEDFSSDDTLSLSSLLSLLRDVSSALLKSKDSFNSSYCLLIARFSSNSSSVFLRIFFRTIQTLLSFSLLLNSSRVCFADLVRGTSGELLLLNLSSSFLRTTEGVLLPSSLSFLGFFGAERITFSDYSKTRPHNMRQKCHISWQ